MREEMTVVEALGRRIVEGAAEMAAHQAAWFGLVAEFDARQGWLVDGMRSMAHWLAWRCGLDLRTAREHARVASALGSLPALATSFAEGRLSYSKVRACTRVATPENEAMVLEWATTLTASQLETVVAAYARTHAEPPSLKDEADRRARCGAVTWVDRDGLHHTELISAPEDGRLIELALDYGREQVWKATKTPVRGPSGRLDALLLVLRRGLANLERGVLDESRHLLVTHVRDASAWVTDEGMVDLDGTGKVVHPRVLQRLGCDALMQGMLEGLDGRPLDLGRRSRTATRDQKTALVLLHPSCVFGGCTVKSKDCEFHHLDFWAAGGRTDLDNLRPVCRAHHRLVHEGGWRMVLDVQGGVVLLPPGGRAPLTSVGPLSEVAVPAGALVGANRRAGVAPDASACESLGGFGWGERMPRWALAEIVRALLECGPPAGRSGAARPQGPAVDERLVAESPPPSAN